MDRFETKIDKVLEHAANTDVTLAKQQAALDEHMRRTEANEKHIKLVETAFKPLEKSHILWSGLGKIVLALHGLGAGILAALKWVFHKI